MILSEKIVFESTLIIVFEYFYLNISDIFHPEPILTVTF